MHAMDVIHSLKIILQEKILGEHFTKFVQEGIENVPLRKRHTQQKLATLMGVSKTTVHHWIVVSTIHDHL